VVARRARVSAPFGGGRVRGLAPGAGDREQPGSADLHRGRRRRGPHWQPGHGHQLPPYARTDAALHGAAKLIRKLHSAAAGFAPVITSYRFDPRPPQPGEVVSHGDLGPWNTVYRDGIPVAFIDWDSAGPVDPLADLAAAAWTFVPLAPPRQLAEAGFDPLPDLPARLRTFVDAYGLADRKVILPGLQRCRPYQREQLRWL
jgi:aminoglycoside phosphotransferase (APT) family kinase protein